MWQKGKEMMNEKVDLNAIEIVDVSITPGTLYTHFTPILARVNLYFQINLYFLTNLDSRTNLDFWTNSNF